MKSVTTLVIIIFSGLSTSGAVYDSDGSAESVQALHRKASNGDTITLPPGTFTWSRPVTISKAIRLQGAGSGRIIGNTKSSVTVGIGTKTFSTSKRGLPIVAGQTLQIAKMPHPPGGSGLESNPSARGTYMAGTVKSYSDTTLVMEVTNTGGSGTFTFWWIATKPETSVVNRCTGREMLLLQENSAGPIEVTGIQFTNQSTAAAIRAATSAYLTPKTLIHDCWFQAGGNSDAPCIRAETNQLLIWNCSFDNTFNQPALGIQLKWEDQFAAPSWSTDSTMGSADTNGATNLYIEDCDFHGFLNATDFDGSARAVFRHNLLDNSGMGSHGADTGPIGMRHVEIYDNELIFDNFGDCNGSVTLPVCWFFWMRGGTGVITDNVLPAISSCAWGNKGNVLFSVLNTRRNSGPYCCWTVYPAPHQIGQGYGPGAVFHKYRPPRFWARGEEFSYYIYSEPVYIWNNKGTAGDRVGLSAESADPCGNGQQLTDYIQEGRDYRLEPKPGYTKYTHPHPLRSSISSIQQVKRSMAISPQEGQKPEKKGWGRHKENKKKTKDTPVKSDNKFPDDDSASN